MKKKPTIPDLVHPTSNIDRVRRHQPFRISGGLHIKEDFQSVDGMLVLSRSCGKWMRPSIYRTVSVSIPKILRENWLAFRDSQRDAQRNSQSQSMEALLSIRRDLASVQAETIGLLLSGSMKAMDHVLAVCVEDPGLWITDFDGQVNYQSLTAPELLAEQTGVSIIDSIPSRDIAAGGDGRCLSPFPHWIMFADRDQRIATKSRVLVVVDKTIQLTFLPPSDGLDSELPSIYHESHLGLGLIDAVLAAINPAVRNDDFGKIAVQGRLNQEFLDKLTLLYHQSAYQNGVSNHWITNRADNPFVLQVIAVAKQANLEIVDVLCTIHHFFAANIEAFIKRVNIRQQNDVFKLKVNELILAGRGEQNGLLRQLLEQRSEMRIAPLEEFGMQETDLQLATTCVLGLLHIDQCPTSLPLVTGADSPRILGRLTPGCPTNWRCLLIEMADYRPPAMKLKDAV